ncbi:hypothetical protein [Parashewanella tropica]|uniref:hypothetical protein n=1 Tax=Parashewanella tropica TaxID=2547970 RepID=UPI0010595A30|nr:hypothetical protein [Parashewanella tropica]
MLPAQCSFNFSLDWDKKAKQFSSHQINEHKKFVQGVNQTFQNDVTEAVIIFSDNKMFLARKSEAHSLVFVQLCKPRCCLSRQHTVEKPTAMSRNLSSIYTLRHRDNGTIKGEIGTPEIIQKYMERKL